MGYVCLKLLRHRPSDSDGRTSAMRARLGESPAIRQTKRIKRASERNFLPQLPLRVGPHTFPQRADGVAVYRGGGPIFHAARGAGLVVGAAAGSTDRQVKGRLCFFFPFLRFTLGEEVPIIAPAACVSCVPGRDHSTVPG